MHTILGYFPMSQPSHYNIMMASICTDRYCIRPSAMLGLWTIGRAMQTNKGSFAIMLIYIYIYIYMFLSCPLLSLSLLYLRLPIKYLDLFLVVSTFFNPGINCYSCLKFKLLAHLILTRARTVKPGIRELDYRARIRARFVEYS